jgi:DNA-binding CsgD family transcriptional regulator
MDDDQRESRSRLDPDQRQILELILTGLGHRDIAEQLGMSVDEVRARIEDVVERLGARSKLEALIIAIRHGLIDVARRERPIDEPATSGASGPGIDHGATDGRPMGPSGCLDRVRC